MTLSFTQEINGNPTYFVEKIWTGLINALGWSEPEYIDGFEDLNHDLGKKVYEPKLHTIRRDSKDRWKVGNKIHFVINNRTPQRLQFAPVVEVKSIQKIEIKHSVKGFDKMVEIIIDGKKISTGETGILAKNDGFDSLQDFFNYFDKDFTGKIIHWTNLKC